MAKEQKNNGQENNPAFIADLLEKLRRQMNVDSEDTTSDDTAAEETPVTIEDVPARMEDETPVTMPEKQADADDVVPFDLVDEKTEPVEEISPFYTEYVSEADIESVSDTLVDEVEPVVEEDVNDMSEQDASAEQDIIFETTVSDEDSDQYAMDFTAVAPRDTSVDETSGAPLSRTIIPEGGRITERHYVDERYRALFDVPPANEPEQFTMPIDAALPDMPVPDETPAELVYSAETVPEIPEIEAVDPPVMEETTPPLSMWDIPMTPISPAPDVPVADPISVPADEAPEETFALQEPVLSAVDTSVPAEEEPPAFHATERRPRHTLADVDFDQTRGTEHLREKILLEPIESIGGEHAEAQMNRWQQELMRKRRGMRVRSIILAVVVAVLALFELIPPLTEWVLSILLITRVPGAIGLIDLQLLIIACIVGYRPLYRGMAALRFGRVLPETLASFSAVVSLIGGMIYYIAGVGDTYLFALTGSIVICGAVLADLCRAETLVHTYRAYAAPDSHFAGVLTRAHEHRLIRELYTDGHDPVLMETEPTSRVDGYIGAVRERVEGRRASLISLSIAGGIALVDLILLLILREGVAFSFWSALVVFSSILPLSLFGVHRYLAHMLSARIAEERIGITGEDAVYRYSACGVMSFTDTEAFPNGSVQVKGIKLCGDFRLDKALYLVSSLFDRIGGPLNGVFRISTADVRISDDVEIRVLAPQGIEGQVNREDVAVGTRAYLEGIGIEIFRDVEDERAEQDGNRVLYVAYRGILVAKFYVKYDISPAFEKNVEYYAKHGVSSVIVTADPLMNDALLDSISYISDYDVRFVKRDLASLMEDHNIPREVELITYGPRKSLRRMPFFFKKYVICQRIATVLSMVGVGFSAVLVPLALALIPLNTALFAVLMQLAALAPTAIIGLIIRRMNPNP